MVLPIDTTDSIGCPTSSEAAEYATKIVDRYDAALVDSIRYCAIRQSDPDFLDIVGRRIHASHNTLIIAFEEDTDQGERLDSDVQLCWRQLLPEGGVTHREESRRVKGGDDLWSFTRRTWTILYSSSQ